MAASLGSLVVKLALDAAEFTRGLTKAEREAQSFKRALEGGLSAAASGIGIAVGAIAVAATAAAVAINELSKETARFKDLEEITGASAESLAGFAVSAGTAGTAMDSIAVASVKLTKSMTGVDDESKAAGAALAALGIPIKEFKRLDPAAQLETVAKALAGFEDGGQKAAVAVALFGKAGALLLPFLKQLAEDGGRQVILTQAQIEAADKYSDAQARLRTQISLYAQVIAADALPVIGDFIKALVDSFNATGNLGNAVKDFSKSGGFAEWFRDVARAAAASADVLIDWYNAAKITFAIIPTGIEQLGGLAQQFRGVGKLATGQFKSGFADIGEGFDTMRSAGRLWVGSITEAVNRTTLLTRVNKQFAISQLDARDAIEGAAFKPKRKELVFDGAAKADKAARAERLSDAERYLQNLEKQLEKTHDLSTAEQVVVDILSGRLKLSNGITEAQLLDVAQRIDLAKSEAKAAQDAAKAEEERVRQAIHFQEIAARDLERISESNQALKDEIAILAGGEQARRAIEKARLSSAIALKEDTLATIENAGASTLEIDALKKQIELLKERQGLFTSRNLAQDLAAQAQLIKGYNDEIANSFANEFEAVISGRKKAGDALKDFAKDVEQMVSRIAAKNIAEALFGGGKSSGGIDFGAILAKLFGSVAGAGFASGGSPPVGRPSLVGEQGPEIFWPKVAGTIVPMNEFRSKRAGNVSVTNIINVPQGTSRPSADQIGLTAARYTQRAAAKLG